MLSVSLGNNVVVSEYCYTRCTLLYDREQMLSMTSVIASVLYRKHIFEMSGEHLNRLRDRDNDRLWITYSILVDVPVMTVTLMAPDIHESFCISHRLCFFSRHKHLLQQLRDAKTTSHLSISDTFELSHRVIYTYD